MPESATGHSNGVGAFTRPHLAPRPHFRVTPDGVEALDFLFGSGIYARWNLAERPKVIFLDLKLPRVNGLETLQRIKTDERTRTIPVVILSSSKEELDIARSYDRGVNSCMVKPVDFDKFFQVVEELGFYRLLLNKVPN